MDNKKKKESEKSTKELGESEKKYRQLFEYSMDAAYITTPEGKIIDINQAGLGLFGFSRDEFLKLNVPDIYVDSHLREKAKKILEKEEFLRDFEYRVYKKDRNQITVRESCIAVRDEKGKAIMYYGVLKDITKQKEMEKKLSAIYDLSKEMTLSLDLDQISKMVLDATKKVLNFDYIDLFLVDEEKNELYLIASRGWKERRIYERIPLSGEKGITAYVAKTGESLNILDVRKDKRYLLSSKEAKSELSVPIKVKNKIVGVIDAESEELNAFSEEDQRLLETLASQAGITIENARLYESVEKSLKEFSLIQDVGNSILSILDIDKLLSEIIGKIKEAFRYNLLSLLLIDENKNELYFATASGPSKEVMENLRFKIGEEGIVGRVAKEGKPQLIKDISKCPYYIGGIEKTKSEIAVPLKIKDKVIGVLDAQKEIVNGFSERDVRILSNLAIQISIAIENAKLFTELSSLKEFNETIVSSLNEGIWVEDEKGFCTYANHRMEEMLGYKSLVGKHWKEIIVPEEIDHMEKETGTRQYGSKSSYESILLTSNGENVPVIISPTPLFEKGKFIGTIGVLVDITKQKKMEESRKESEKLYKSLSEFNKKLLESSPAGIMNINKEMKVEYENPEMRRILGLPFGRELSATWKDIQEVPFVEETGISSIFDELRKGKEIFKEISFTFPEGERGHLTLRGVPILENSKFAGAVLLINDITGLKGAEELQASIYKISEATHITQNLEELFHSIHAVISNLMPAKNFYIALYDETAKTISFPYWIDELDERPAPRKWRKGLTEYVLQKGEPLLTTPKIFEELIKKGEIEIIGTSPIDWLGIPLKVKDKIIGVLAVQSYTEGITHDKEDKNILTFISEQVAMTIERKQADIEISRRAEELAVLNELSQTLTAHLSVEEVIKEAYRGASRLMDVSTFTIGLYNPEKEEIFFPFTVTESEIDKKITTIFADQGMNGYVIRNRTSLLIRENIPEWHEKHGLELVGEPPLCWLGVPLAVGNQVVGIMSIQSFTTPRAYGEHEQKLLTSIASQAAIAIQNTRLYEQAQEEITERKRTEEKLKESEERNRAVVEAGGQMREAIILLQDTDKAEAAHLFANEEWVRITGYTIEELREMSYLDLVHLRDRDAVANRLRRRSQGKVLPGPWYISIIAKDGSEIPVEAAGAPVTYQDRPAVVGYIRDITERKKAENRQVVAYRIADAANRATNLYELFGYIRDELGHVIDTTNFYIALYNASNNEVRFPYYIDEKDSPEVIQTLHRKYGEGLTEFIIDTGKAALFYEDDLKKRKSIGYLAKTWLGVPLMTKGNTIGVMAVQSYSDPHAYTQEDLEFMVFVSSQIATVIERKLAEEKLSAIYDLSREMSSSLDLEKILEKVMNACEKVLNFKMISLSLIGEENQDLYIKAHRGLPEEAKNFRLSLREDKGITVWVVNNGESLIVPDVSKDSRYVEGDPEVKSELAAPLKIEEKVIGVLNIESENLDAFSEDDRRLLETLASQAAIAIENARLFEQTQKEITERKKTEEALKESRNKIERLYKIAIRIEASQTEEEVYHTTIEAAKKILKLDMCDLSIAEGDRLVVKATTTPSEGTKDMSINEGIIGKTYRTRKSYLIEDMKKDKDAKPVLEEYRAMISIPVGHVGVFQAVSTQVAAFNEEDIKLGELLMSHVAEALKRIQSEKVLWEERDKVQKYLDVAGVLMVVLDADQKVTLINKKGCEILGYTEKEIIDKNWTDNFVPEEIKDEVKIVYEKLFAGEVEPVKYNENPILTKSGKEKVIAWHNSVLKDKAGNIIGILSSGSDITERRKAEEELRKSKEDYQTIFENLPFVAFTLDKKGRMLEANKWAEEVTGLRLKDAKDKSFSKLGLLGKKDLLKAFIEFRKNLQGKITEKTIYNIKLKDGREILFELIGIPLKEKGKVTKVLDVGSDVTEIKRAEEKLKESEERYRVSIKSAPYGIAVIDRNQNGKFLIFNPQLEKITGYSKKEIPDIQTWLEKLYPDENYRKLVIKERKAITIEERPCIREAVVTRKDGEKRICQFISRIISSGLRIVFISDITERKRAEQIQSVLYKITNAVNITKDLNELFRSIHNHLSTIIDTKNFYIALHDKEKELLSFLYYVDENYPERDATAVTSRKPGKGLTEYVMKLGKGLLVTNKAIKELAEKGEIETIGKLPLVWLGVPLKIDEKVVGVIAVQSYTSPTVYTEEDLKLLEFISDQIAIAIKHKQADEEKEKARKEAEFYSDILGHDVGNINQIISGYLYLLKNAKDEETRKKNVRGIKKSIEKAKRLAESIKTLKIIKDTKIEKFDLNTSIERSIKEIKEYFDRKIEVNLNIDKKYYVKANDFLDKVFFNILENAVEYTFHDPVIIDVKTEEKDGFCSVHIHDYGLGISKEKREDILKNLETLSKRTGIGFYLTKKILDRFNGRFEIKDVKKGTEIVVTLPVINGGFVRNVHAQRPDERNERRGDES